MCHQTPWVQILTLLFTSPVTWSSLLSLFKPQFLSTKVELIVNLPHRAQRSNEIIHRVLRKLLRYRKHLANDEDDDVSCKTKKFKMTWSPWGSVYISIGYIILCVYVYNLQTGFSMSKKVMHYPWVGLQGVCDALEVVGKSCGYACFYGEDLCLNSILSDLIKFKKCQHKQLELEHETVSESKMKPWLTVIRKKVILLSHIAEIQRQVVPRSVQQFKDVIRC